MYISILHLTATMLYTCCIILWMRLISYSVFDQPSFLNTKKKKWRKKKLTIYKVHSHLYCLHLLFNFYLYLVVKYVDLFPVSFFQTSKYSYVQYLHNYCPFFFLLLTSYTFLLKSVPIRLFLSRTNIQLILETGHCKIISRYFLFHLSRQLQRNNFFFKKNFQHHIL